MILPQIKSQAPAALTAIVISLSALTTLALMPTTAFSQTEAGIDHSNMDHAAHMKKMLKEAADKAAELKDKTIDKIQHATGMKPEQDMQPDAVTGSSPDHNKGHDMGHDMNMATPLTEPGNAVFGTIQEAIAQLDANPDTDWQRVDLEALRQHLIDMQNFTLYVDVLSQADIDNGVLVVVQATSKAAQASLGRAMAVHPAMLQSETGWRMTATPVGETYELSIVTDQPTEVARLRALGYIGVMALGNHHQVHHWLMATGANPHG